MIHDCRLFVITTFSGLLLKPTAIHYIFEMEPKKGVKDDGDWC